MRFSSVIFLLHIALDIPIALQGLWSPLNLPFLQLNNTTIVFIKQWRQACVPRLLLLLEPCFGAFAESYVIP
ncbi:hypothetical protein EIP86_002662 [Pleurotus ostreatoroseus]|nr:hypothetical protein EIP86_002662 [Pleurotus ostreatoroseus]